MKVKPMLGDWEIPRIESIESFEHRFFVELPIPGMTGSLFHDMNTHPAKISISGSLYGDEVRDEFLETLREKYNAGEPVIFVADIVTATDIQYVIIEALEFSESGVKADQIDYHILLAESPPPPPSSSLGGLDMPGGLEVPDIGDLDAIDTDLLDQAGDFLDSVTGALDVIDALGTIPDLGNPVEPLSGLLSDFESITGGLPDTLSSLTAIFGEPENG
jgi:hypothetical protein